MYQTQYRYVIRNVESFCLMIKNAIIWRRQFKTFIALRFMLMGLDVETRLLRHGS